MPVSEQLQCGHGTEAVENDAMTVRQAYGHRASMRPRHRGRGEHPATVRAALQAQLQCGHGTEAVENMEATGPIPNASPELQCGHGTEAVENTETATPYS